MRGRLIYNILLTDARVSRLTDYEFRVWIALLLLANDWGCLDADIEEIALKAPACASKRLSDALENLVKQRLLECYRYDGRLYLHHRRWDRYQEQRTDPDSSILIPLHPDIVRQNKERLSARGYFRLFPGESTIVNGFQNWLINAPTIAKRKSGGMITRGKKKIKRYDDLQHDYRVLLQRFKQEWDRLGLPGFISWDSTCYYARQSAMPRWEGVLRLIMKHPAWNKEKWKDMLRAVRRDPWYRQKKLLTIDYFLRNINGGTRVNSPRSVTAVAEQHLVEINRERARIEKENKQRKLQEEYYERQIRAQLASSKNNERIDISKEIDNLVKKKSLDKKNISIMHETQQKQKGRK